MTPFILSSSLILYISPDLCGANIISTQAVRDAEFYAIKLIMPHFASKQLWRIGSIEAEVKPSIKNLAEMAYDIFRFLEDLSYPFMNNPTPPKIGNIALLKKKNMPSSNWHFL